MSCNDAAGIFTQGGTSKSLTNNTVYIQAHYVLYTAAALFGVYFALVLIALRLSVMQIFIVYPF